MDQLVGMGLYSVQEAARLLNADVRELKRWFFGYEYKNAEGKKVWSEPIWPLRPRGLDVDAFGFEDLMEARFVAYFRQHGVRIEVIRAAWKEARTLFKTPFPFTQKRFLTDGKRIFAEALQKVGNDPQLLDLGKRQFAMHSILKASLYAGIEMHNKRAIRWFPTTSKDIVIDPAIAFGKPVVAKFNVPTAALARALDAEGGDVLRRVAATFEVPTAAVRAASKFERSLVESGRA